MILWKKKKKRILFKSIFNELNKSIDDEIFKYCYKTLIRKYRIDYLPFRWLAPICDSFKLISLTVLVSKTVQTSNHSSSKMDRSR